MGMRQYAWDVFEKKTLPDIKKHHSTTRRTVDIRLVQEFEPLYTYMAERSVRLNDYVLNEHLRKMCLRSTIEDYLTFRKMLKLSLGEERFRKVTGAKKVLFYYQTMTETPDSQLFMNFYRPRKEKKKVLWLNKYAVKMYSQM